MSEEITSAIIQAGATVIAAVIAAILFALYERQKDRLEHAKAFRDLFNEFNRRFNSLNEDLNRIRLASINKTPLSEKQISIVQDYLNLCAEEYLWTKGKYPLIRPEIWAAWLHGIKYYINEVPEIKEFFRSELISTARESYYGLAQELSKELDY